MTQDVYVPHVLFPGQEHIFLTMLSGLYFIKATVHEDERGWFTEPLNIRDLESILGYPLTVCQANLSRSETGVIRGFHAEGWNKMVTVIQGLAYCVLADIRPQSPTFGQTVKFWLDARSTHPGSLYIEAGIANSVCAIEGPVYYHYLVDRLYQERDRSGDVAINLFDPDLAVEWPTAQSESLISQRDKTAVSLRSLFPEKF